MGVHSVSVLHPIISCACETRNGLILNFYRSKLTKVTTLPLTTLNSCNNSLFFHIIRKLKFVTILAKYILPNSSEICICIL